MKRITIKSHRAALMFVCAAGMFLTLNSSVAQAALKAPTPSRLKALTPAKNRAALPAEVSAMTPTGMTSLHFGRLLPGPKGQARLVHIWVAPRKTQSIQDRRTWLPSPFCVDLFEEGKKKGTWEFAATTVYIGENKPSEIEVRWLRTKKKQGPVIVLVSPAYMHTLYTVITFPNVGTDDWDKFGAVQEFSQGGVGGGKTTHDFGVDKNGTMTVETESSYMGKDELKTVRTWNGREYADPEGD